MLYFLDSATGRGSASHIHESVGVLLSFRVLIWGRKKNQILMLKGLSMLVYPHLSLVVSYVTCSQVFITFVMTNFLTPSACFFVFLCFFPFPLLM